MMTVQEAPFLHMKRSKIEYKNGLNERKYCTIEIKIGNEAYRMLKGMDWGMGRKRNGMERKTRRD